MSKRRNASIEEESPPAKRKRALELFERVHSREPANGIALQHLKNEFDCKLCGNLLRTPIMIFGSLGNVCGIHRSLRHLELEGTFVPNGLLDLIIENVSFPCKYKRNGCTSIQAYGDLPNHQKNCVHQTTTCWNINCTWVGPMEAMSNHFLFCHPECTFDDEQQFAMDVGELLSDESERVSMLKKNEHVYFFRISRLESGDLLYSVYKGDQAGDDDTSRSTTTAQTAVVAYLTHFCHNEEYKVQCNVQPMYTAPYCNGVVVSKTVLQKLALSSGILKVSLKVITKHKRNLHQDGALQRLLDCAICLQPMRKPIFVGTPCGHSVCGTCKPRLNRCGVCRGSSSWIRNYTLEEVVEQLNQEPEPVDAGSPPQSPTPSVLPTITEEDAEHSNILTSPDSSDSDDDVFVVVLNQEPEPADAGSPPQSPTPSVFSAITEEDIEYGYLTTPPHYSDSDSDDDVLVDAGIDYWIPPNYSVFRLG